MILQYSKQVWLGNLEISFDTFDRYYGQVKGQTLPSRFTRRNKNERRFFCCRVHILYIMINIVPNLYIKHSFLGISSVPSNYIFLIHFVASFLQTFELFCYNFTISLTIRIRNISLKMIYGIKQVYFQIEYKFLYHSQPLEMQYSFVKRHICN